MTDPELFDRFADIGNGVLQKVNHLEDEGPVKRAIVLLTGRIVESGNSLTALNMSNIARSWVWDGASIVRTSYDAMLQALYILHDNDVSQRHAARFLDFQIIERVKLLDLFMDSSTEIGVHLAKSPLRIGNEANIRAEYKRVCKEHGFNENKPPQNWYKIPLKDIAHLLKLDHEYAPLHKMLSAIVHSSPFGLNGLNFIQPVQLLWWQWTFAFRVLDRAAEVWNVTLDPTEKAFLEMSRPNIFENPCPE